MDTADQAGDATGPQGAGTPEGRVPPHASGRILDRGALKALANPLRFRLLELLVEGGPSTASGLGRVVGENSGSTSYHLRQLAEHGLIEEASDIGTGRDRFWRAVEGGWTLAGFEMLQAEETAADAQLLLDEVLRSKLERVQRWHREGPRWGRAWVDASIEMQGRLRLTRTHLAQLTDELVAVVERYREQEVADDEPDAALISVQLDAYPTEEPPPSPVDEPPSEAAS